MNHQKGSPTALALSITMEISSLVTSLLCLLVASSGGNEYIITNGVEFYSRNLIRDFSLRKSDVHPVYKSHPRTSFFFFSFFHDWRLQIIFNLRLKLSEISNFVYYVISILQTHKYVFSAKS